MKCDVCSGRGWVRAHAVPAVACPFCDGKGELSWGQVARKLDEDPGTIARVRQGRCKPATAERIFKKISEVLWPSRQTEMFT
jgi:hypothetical protein